MASSTQALHQALRATFRDYRTHGDPEFLKLAPVIDSGRNGDFLVFTDVARLDARVAPQVAADSADFLPANFELQRIQYNCDRVVGNSFILPNDTIADLEEGSGDLDLVESAVARGVRPIFGKMIQDFLTEAAAQLSAPSAGALDISPDNLGVQYTDYMLAAMEEVEISTGMRPTHWYVGVAAANQLRQLDEIQNGTAIGVGTTGDVVRRTGMITDSQLQAWHRDVLGLELVVERETFVNTSGTAAYIVTTQGVLAVSNPGRGEGCFKTLNKVAGRDGDLAQFYVRETGPGQAVGLGCDVDAYYKIKAVGPAAGRIATLTIS